MNGLSTGHWRSLERRASTVYVVAGAVLIIYAGMLSYQAFVDPTMNFHDNEAAIVGPIGFAIGFVGLLGIYPALAGASPRLAKAGAAIAGVGIVGWVVIALSGIASQAGIDVPVAIQALGFLGFLGMLGAYGAFGAATLRTGRGVPLLGILLLAPPILFVLLMVSNEATGGTAVGAVIISTALCLTHLGLGAVLRTDRGPAHLA